MSARILVVEDEEALTTLLRYNLDAEGYDVETVGRGDDADTRLKERVPDLVVLDWMLPGLSGIELCRRLRARPETKQLPIIMLTARGEDVDRILGLEMGADDYLAKPFNPRELLARINAVLRRQAAARNASATVPVTVTCDGISACTVRRWPEASTTVTSIMRAPASSFPGKATSPMAQCSGSVASTCRTARSAVMCAATMRVTRSAAVGTSCTRPWTMPTLQTPASRSPVS